MNISHRCISNVTLPMAQPSGVEGRVKAILKMNKNRGVLTQKVLWLGGAVALLILLLLMGLRFGSVGMPSAAALTSTPAALTWQAPLPHGTIAAPSSQEVTLSNGIQVKLLGFAQNPSRNAPWSTPNGRAGIKSPYLSADETDNGGSDLHREFAVYLDGLRLQAGDVHFAAMPAPRVLGGGASCNVVSYERHGNDFSLRSLQAIVASFPDTKQGSQTGAFLFGVASGSWQTATTKRFMKDGNTSSSWTSGATILISASRDRNRPLIVSVADDVNSDMETRIVAVDQHGVSHKPELLDAGGSVTTSFSGVHSLDEALRSYHNIYQSLVTFPGLPLRNVREVRFQTRPYQWVLFKNLALYPILTPPLGRL